jgi:CDP-diacylglycerol--serine O-phosphatidyltransferase
MTRQMVLTALIGLLMVINVPYYSGKALDSGGRVPFAAILAVVFLFSLVTLDPPKVLLATFVIYACSGPLMLLIKGRRSLGS